MNSIRENQSFIPQDPTLQFQPVAQPIQFINNLTPPQASRYFPIGYKELTPHRIMYSSDGFIQKSEPIPQNNYRSNFYQPNLNVRVNMKDMGSKFI